MQRHTETAATPSKPTAGRKRSNPTKQIVRAAMKRVKQKSRKKHEENSKSPRDFKIIYA